MNYTAFFLLLAVLGFSLGDELGFKESLTNVESSRRRSVQGSSKLQAALAQHVSNNGKSMPVWPGPPITPSTAPPKPEASTIPPFKPIPPAPERPTVSTVNVTKRVGSSVPTPVLMGMVPSLNALPPSITRLASPGKLDKKPAVAVIVPISKQRATEKMGTEYAVRRLSAAASNEVAPSASASTIQAISAVTNISAEAIEAALLMRQQQMLRRTTPPTTTTTTTTRKPPSKHVVSHNKVMNAPREYYPVGYDKNFDDNFASRVDLPETSFYCGDQKHFPGLYADEDLGCMVFHVCALTDDGLIMKSFLCPESTLFDQTILKCNWWFYVECRNSRKLYDSNIPVSKSYQLMKALTFFSTYKNDAQAKPKED